MKILLDTCVWGGAVKILRDYGHDIVWAGDWSEDPGDEEILAIAYHENRTLVTLDKDFGELAIVREKPHSGIVRLVNLAARQQGIVCQRALELYEKELESGAIVTVDPGRVRIRPPDEEV
jgi:predicted nuclease of predicted toxin-antitoxin system